MPRRHISTSALAAQTGLSARWLIAKAALGEIPGAYQPNGPRGAWRFDEALFWRWWESKRSRPMALSVGTPAADLSQIKPRGGESPLRRQLRLLKGGQAQRVARR